MAIINPPSTHTHSPPRWGNARTLVGRLTELQSIESALERAGQGLFGVSLEGEPGIGKSTLVLTTADLAAARGFVTVVVAADEELRGPFLVARSIFNDEMLVEASRSPAAVEAVTRVQNLLRGADDNDGFELTREERLIRVFDLAAIALRAVANDRPLALLVDDVQWADQDSIRLLRYLVRASPTAPIFLVIATRPEETVLVAELVNLLADLDRMGLLQRLRLARFRQADTAALMRQLLGPDVDLAAVATVHAQAEGVPFIVEELIRTYREAGLVQQIGQRWSLAKNADRLVPSAVRTLIQRRAASVEDEAKPLLGVAAVLGRTFRVADVCAVRTRLGDSCDVESATRLLHTPLESGLINEAGAESGGDYAFSHEQVREFCIGLLAGPQRRATHSAIADMLTAEGEPAPETLSHVVRHAIAAGDAERTATFSIQAGRAALEANAAEEANRLIEQALAIVSRPQDRVELLRVRDDALGALGRPGERLDAIAEFAALAEATADDDLQLEVLLRRAAALRIDGQHDAAAQLARRVRERAAGAGSVARELAACLELGQDLLRSALGEGYAPSASESDLEGAEEAFRRAAELAEQLNETRSLAAALRELGVIKLAIARAWFVERIKAGDHIPMLQAVAAGVPLDELKKDMPIAPIVDESGELMERALDLFESAGDRRGAMSAIIGLAYLEWGAQLHLGPNPAERVEGIRKLAVARLAMTRESEREMAEAQMLYSVHVFARSKVIPDLAVLRGREAYEQARTVGESNVEFLAAVGTALAYLDVGDVGEAEAWLARAETSASRTPTPHRAIRIGTCRALIAAARGNVAAMRDEFGRALQLAVAQRRPSAQCEILALQALETARLGSALDDAEVLAEAERTARETRRLCSELPGHALWSAQASAAASRAALARRDTDEALRLAREALGEREAAMREDPHLEILLPAARAVLQAGTDEEKQFVRTDLQLTQAMVAQRTLDEGLRVRWFRGPIGTELGELAGPLQQVPVAAEKSDSPLADDDVQLLRLLIEGRTNREIGAALGTDETSVSRALASLYARIGTSSRAEATAFAFRASGV